MSRKKNATRKDGRIAVQVYLGLVDGKRKYKTVYGKTQKEADQKALEVKLSMKKGIDVTSDHDTFKQWRDRWLSLKKTEVSGKRYNSYKSVSDKFERLFDAPICKLKTNDFQTCLLDIALENPKTGKPASKDMLKEMKQVAAQICSLAVDNRVLEYNPALAVKLPKNAPEPEQRRALTLEERKWVVNTPHRAQRAAMIMLYSGLRRGELVPLTWDDIDLKNKTLSVNKTVEYVNGAPRVKSSAKSRTSIRVINIPEKLVEYLKTQVKGNRLVCPSAKGKMMSESAWKRMWESYLLELNVLYGDFSTFKNKPKSKFDPKGVPFVIPRFTAHWLRHTYATMLYFAGVDVMTAKEWLGHADIQTTLKFYTHLDSLHKGKVVDKFDDYLENAI